MPANGSTTSACRPRAASSGGILAVHARPVRYRRLLAAARRAWQQRARHSRLPGDLAASSSCTPFSNRHQCRHADSPRSLAAIRCGSKLLADRLTKRHVLERGKAANRAARSSREPCSSARPSSSCGGSPSTAPDARYIVIVDFKRVIPRRYGGAPAHRPRSARAMANGRKRARVRARSPRMAACRRLTRSARRASERGARCPCFNDVTMRRSNGARTGCLPPSGQAGSAAKFALARTRSLHRDCRRDGVPAHRDDRAAAAFSRRAR